MTRRSALLAAAAFAALLLGLWGYWGTPRLTLSNSGLGIDYPSPRTLAILAAAAAAAALAFAAPRRALAIVALMATAGLTILGLHRLVYRLEVGPDGLSARDLRGSRRLAWRDVTKVEAELHTLLLEGRGSESIPIDTSGFTAQQQASLERAVARHVEETQASQRPPAPPGS